MEPITTLHYLVVAAALFVAASVGASTAAQGKDSGTMVLNHEVTLSGSHLTEGAYKVQWQTHSPEATVSILRKNKVVATAEGKVVDRGTKYPSDEVLYNNTADGARTILEIRFRNSSQVIVFNE